MSIRASGTSVKPDVSGGEGTALDEVGEGFVEEAGESGGVEIGGTLVRMLGSGMLVIMFAFEVEYSGNSTATA